MNNFFDVKYPAAKTPDVKRTVSIGVNKKKAFDISCKYVSKKMKLKYYIPYGIEEFLQSKLEMSDIRSSFPTMQLLYSSDGIYSSDIVDLGQWTCLDTRYKLCKFIQKNDSDTNEKNIEDLIKCKHQIYTGITHDFKKQVKKRVDFFVKMSSLIETETAMRKSDNFDEKLNFLYTNPYIDGLCTGLLSKITENGISPNFPLMYGLYFGTAKNMKINITEEYNDWKDLKWFQKSNNNWTIEIIENDDDSESSDEENQDEENQDEENQDEENQDEENQDEENQDEENQDEENQDEENQDEDDLLF